MAKILTSIHGKLLGLLANGALSTKGLTRDEDSIVNATAATLVDWIVFNSVVSPVTI